MMPIARASMSVLLGARARRAASPACAPVTPLYCGLLCCALYDVSCSVGLLHKTYAVAPTQPISFVTVLSRARFFFKFYASSRPDLPTLGPFTPFPASSFNSRPNKFNSPSSIPDRESAKC